jgi:hypothetical protein
MEAPRAASNERSCSCSIMACAHDVNTLRPLSAFRQACGRLQRCQAVMEAAHGGGAHLEAAQPLQGLQHMWDVVSADVEGPS